MMMTEMFLFACVESGPVVTTVPSIETTTAPDSGGKELRANVNLRPLLCSESECCLLYTSPSPRDLFISRMPSSA